MKPGLLPLVCVMVGLILAVLWLFAYEVEGFAVPGWVAPSSVIGIGLGNFIFFLRER